MKAVSRLTDTSDAEDAGHIAMEATSGYRTVTAFGLQGHMLALFSKALEKELRLSTKRATAAGLGTGASSFVMFASYSAGEPSVSHSCAIAIRIAYGYAARVCASHLTLYLHTIPSPVRFPAVFYAGAQLINRNLLGFQDMLQTFFAIVMAAQGIGMASSFQVRGRRRRSDLCP